MEDPNNINVPAVSVITFSSNDTAMSCSVIPHAAGILLSA